MSKIKRNDPCPCGSGKKFKKCCIHQWDETPVDSPTAMEAAGTPNSATDFLNEFKTLVGDRPFDSMAELQTALDGFGEEQNKTPVLDFLGLTPEQMFRLRRHPLAEMPDVVDVQTGIEDQRFIHAPIVVTAIAVLGAIAEEGRLKTTATGNLPQRTVRELHQQLGGLMFCERKVPGSETHMPDLFFTRNLLMLCGLVEEEGKYFYLTTLGVEFLDSCVTQGAASRLYRHLFLNCVDRFNWLFDTGYEDECGDMQHAALFCFYILHKKARSNIDRMKLAAHFTRAFPSVADTMSHRIPQITHDLATSVIEQAFDDLFIGRICYYFGFLTPKPASGWARVRDVRTSELFDAVFHWK